MLLLDYPICDKAESLNKGEDNRVRIVICDDEVDAVRMIASRLDSIIGPSAEFECIGFTNAGKVIEMAKTEHIDLLLVDIEMPEMKGFEVVRQVKLYNEDILVIFITNLDMYVYESFKYHPFRFIRKSHIHEMEEAVTSALLLIKNRVATFEIHINNMKQMKVKVCDILYFESLHNNVRVVMKEGEYTYRSTLKSIEKDLEGQGFVRIHSGYLLNIRHVHVISNKDVQIFYREGYLDLPVSRGKRNHLISEYKKSLR